MPRSSATRSRSSSDHCSGELETTGDTTQDELRTATIARVHQHLELNVILSAKEGVREGQEDAAICNNEIKLLPQGIKDKLNILAQIQSRIETMEKEEAKIREDIHKMMVESKIEHGILSKRLVEIDQLDKILVE